MKFQVMKWASHRHWQKTSHEILITQIKADGQFEAQQRPYDDDDFEDKKTILKIFLPSCVATKYRLNKRIFDQWRQFVTGFCVWSN